MTMPHALTAYAFEAHAIQRYILDSGRLRDMIGASELVMGSSTP